MSAGFEQAQFAWAELLMRSFVEAGVREVVISPGSRSTPFVLAAIRQPKLRCYDAIDERSAGFFALGMAKVTDRPSLLLCTSGTAGAHYFPAVIEAGMSFTPLLVLTADRPFELQGCQAPQTIDQVKLFGDHARFYFELGIADSTAEAQRRLRSAVVQAALLARSPLPGAVHLNARARKPLEPTSLEPAPRDRRPLGPTSLEPERDRRSLGPTSLEPAPRDPWNDDPIRAFAPRLVPDESGVDSVARAIMASRRGIIVAGPGPISSVQARNSVHGLARLTHFPFLAEAASQFRFAAPMRSSAEENAVVFCDGFDALLRSAQFGHLATPDLILQLGAPPTSSAWEKFSSAHDEIERWVIAPQGWNDPQSTARGFLFGGIADTATAITARVRELAKGGSREPSEWERVWAKSEMAARHAADAVLAESGDRLSEGSVAQAVVRGLPRGSVLALGNSLPIRQVDAFCPGDLADCLVWSQRGANGIDGLVSGAAGAASMGYPTTLLLGDVSFLHDVGGLALARDLKDPFVVIIVHNDGGRMFEQLPLAQMKGIEREFDHWITPHGRSFEHAAGLYDCRYHRVETNDGLRSALSEAHQRAGGTIIEAVVPPHGAIGLQRQLQQRLDIELQSSEAVP